MAHPTIIVGDSSAQRVDLRVAYVNARGTISLYENLDENKSGWYLVVPYVSEKIHAEGDEPSIGPRVSKVSVSLRTGETLDGRCIRTVNGDAEITFTPSSGQMTKITVPSNLVTIV